MSRRARARRAVAIAALGLLAAFSAQAAAPLRVVATIEPLGMLVRAIGGARVTVVVLVPPAASPHSFEPQPSDVAKLVDAALVAEVGAGLDTWLHRLLGASDRTAPRFTLMASAGLAPLPADAAHGHGGERDAALDPHAWLDPLRVRDAVVPALAAALSGVDPDGRAAYEASAAAFREALTALDAEIRATLDAHGRRFVSFHAAWRYFAARYALEELGVVEEAPGEEPTASDLAHLVERARAAHVPAILVEPQLSPRVARVLAAEFGATTVLVDPNGDPADAARDDYLDLMRFNARAFAQALGAPPP